MLKLVLPVKETVPDEFTTLIAHFTLILVAPVLTSAKCTLALVEVPTVLGFGEIEFSVTVT
jgi:hypothetical protein